MLQQHAFEQLLTRGDDAERRRHAAPSWEADAPERIPAGAEPDADGKPTEWPASASRADRYLADTLLAATAWDAGSAVDGLMAADCSRFVREVGPAPVAHLLSVADRADAARVLDALDTTGAAAVLAAVDPDDRVRLLDRLPDGRWDELVAALPAAAADEVRAMEEYPPDSVGRLMSPHVSTVPITSTVAETVAEIGRLHAGVKRFYYVYAVDDQRRLVGAVSMRDLVLSQPGRAVAELVRGRVVAVRATDDQPTAADLIRRHGFLALPVVDRRRRLVGQVTAAALFDTVEREASAGLPRLYGAGGDEGVERSWVGSFLGRAPWLYLYLVGAFVAAAVVSRYEATIGTVAALAVYMPVVAGVAGNAGGQSMAVTVRSLALGRRPGRTALRACLRETGMGLALGALVGLTTAALAACFFPGHGLGLAAVAGGAIVVNTALACALGTGIPLLLRAAGFDPAQSAATVVTALTDLAAFATVLGGTTWLYAGGR